MRHRRLLLAGVCAGAVALAGPAGASAALRTFQSPSGNIDCIMDGGASVRCDIQSKSWPRPPKPKNCPVDWGQGLGVDATKRGYVICAGDTALAPPGDPYPVLAYGKRIKVGGITCSSATAGITCRNRQGHGFFLSRQRYRLF